MVLYHVWTNKAPSPGKKVARTRVSAEAPFDLMPGLLEFRHDRELQLKMNRAFDLLGLATRT